jgi:predicted membrane protein
MRVVRTLVRVLVAFTVAVTAASLVSTVAALAMRDRFPDDAEPEDDEIDVATILRGRQFRSEATAFRGGRVIAWQGGADIDLRAAKLDPAGAHLEVVTAFGGMRVRVPEDWRVRMEGVAIFGGAGSTAPAPADGDPAPVLTIHYRTIFGGFGVAAEPDDERLVV